MKPRKISSLVVLVVGLFAIGMWLFKAKENGKRPEVEIDQVEATILSAAQLYPVLDALAAEQISTNWSAMVKLSKVALTTDGNIPREYVSVPKRGANLISKEKSGIGGWFFDPAAKSLAINIAKPFTISFRGESFNVSPDFLIVDKSGIRVAIEGGNNGALANVLNDVRARAEGIIKLLESK